MQRSIMRFAAMATMAAGMAFAQAPPAPRGGGQPGARMGRWMGGGMGRGLFRNLNLTDAQKQQAQAIFQEQRQTSQAVRDQLKQNRDALQTAIKNNDTAQIQQLSIAAGQMQGELLAGRSTAMAKFYAILTPDQKAQADQLWQKGGPMMRRRAAAQQ